MKNDEAVSPVIGVILMVAITVILAAVIAAFVFGMAGTVKPAKNVGATISRINSGNITAVYVGGSDAYTLTSIKWGVNSDPIVIQNSSQALLNIGSSITLHAPPRSIVTGTGVFNDGIEQVIIQQTL